jgi:hypothetical protein
MGLLDDNGIEKIDLLQVDTEGFDAQVVSMIDFSRIVPTMAVHHLTEAKRIASQFGPTPMLARIDAELADLA